MSAVCVLAVSDQQFVRSAVTKAVVCVSAVCGNFCLGCVSAVCGNICFDFSFPS